MYELLVANLDYSNSPRRMTENGVEYLVADAVILKGDQILNGSNGPLLYPDEEVKANPGIWNETPVSNGHPKYEGKYVSIKHPKLPKSTKIGFLRNDRYEGKKRKVKVWLNIEATNSSDPRIIPAIEARKKVGLSTGLVTDNYPNTRNELHKGKVYTHVARNYRPDHLAVLVDVPGACSTADGCGINMNQATETPAAGGFFQNLFGFFQAAPAEAMQQLYEIAETENAKKQQPSDKAQVSSGKACKILKDGSVNGHPLTKDQQRMFGVICSRSTKNESITEEDIANLADESIQEKMSRIYAAFKDAHPSRYNIDTGYPEKTCYLLDAYDGYVIYQERDGDQYATYRHDFTDEDGTITFTDDPVEVRRVVSYEPVGNEAAEYVVVEQGSSNQSASYSEENDMPQQHKLTDAQRKTIRDDLAANKDTKVGLMWKNLNLNEVNDDGLVAYHQALRNFGGTIVGNVNPDGSRVIEQPAAPTNNCGCPGTANAQPQQTQQAPAQQAPQIPAQVISPVAPPLVPTGNALFPGMPRPASFAEALETFGTPEEKATWNAVMQTLQQQKTALLGQILANINDPTQKQAAFDIYKDMQIAQLQTILATMPRPQQQPPAQHPQSMFGFNFGGAGGFPITPAAPSPEVKPLKQPTYNYRPKVPGGNN
jgi:hypothetical protein